MEQEESGVVYPSLIDRVKAVMADTFLLILFMLFFSYLFGLFNNVPDNARTIAFAFVFFFYDPIFTSAFGGTLGHHLVGLKVIKNSTGGKVPIYLSLLRFVVKALLGWMSLLTVTQHAKSNAIHDLLVGSTVVFKKER